MLEEDKYCIDIQKQTFAIRGAILEVEAMLMEWHLEMCILEGVRNGREEVVLGELVELYTLANR